MFLWSTIIDTERKEMEANMREKISSSHGGEYDVQSCLLGCTAV
jgi:hypothetical protein